MAVSTTNAYDGPFSANGVTRSFPFTFTAQTTADVAVLLDDQPITEGYSVELYEGGGGTVTFATAPGPGRLVVWLDPDFTQTTAFENGSAWLAAPVNLANDRAALRDQALSRDLARCLRIPLGENAFTLPAASKRKSRFLGFDTDGKAVAVDGTTAAPASAAMVATQDGSNVEAAIAARARADALAAATGAAMIGVADGTTLSDAVNAMWLTSFAAASSRTVPTGIKRVRTRGHGSSDVGGATYVAFDLGSTSANEALRTTHPRAVFKTANGRYFRLAADQDHRPDMFGAAGGGADDTVALAALFAYSDRPHLGHFGEVWRTTQAIACRSGQVVRGNFGKIERPDHLDHILSLIDVDGVRIEGVWFSHNFAGGVMSRSNKSAIYGLRASNVTVRNCQFSDTGLFAVSSDQSGPGWSVCDNRFYRIAGTAVDLRGTLSDGTGKGFQVCRNYIDTTGDDAIAVAYFSQAGIIAENIIFNPGQLVTYDLWSTDNQLHQAGGGGIRFNGRQTVCNNQIFNANLFFICAASYSRDLTAAPSQALVFGNVGKGIKPTINNTTACVLVKSVDSVLIGINDFDARGDTSLAVTAVADNGAGKVRLTMASAHGLYEGNRVRFEDASGVGAEAAVLAVVNATQVDLNLTYSASYTASNAACWPSVAAVRVYTDTVAVANIADNGAGKMRITATDLHNYVDGDVVRLVDAGGIASLVATVTVVNTLTFDLASVSYSGGWTGGGATWKTAAPSRRVRIQGARFRNVEQGLYVRGGGGQQVELNGCEIENFTYAFAAANYPQMTELVMRGCTLRNSRALASGALFWGGGLSTSITIGTVQIIDNRLVPGSYGVPAYPLDFTSITVARADVLRNCLGGATGQFQNIGNIPLFLFDGDWSEVRHGAGTVPISAGQTVSTPVSHGLSRAPRTGEIRLQKVSSGAAVGGGALSVEYITSTSFTVRCDTAPASALTVAWSIEPMVRKYVNGTTGAL